ncbi:MAG: hypothetical protein WBX14_03515 [Candidatus Udaeobacter sp.]
MVRRQYLVIDQEVVESNQSPYQRHNLNIVLGEITGNFVKD